MIRVTNFSKRYGNMLAVDRLSFTARPGDVIGLIGPNGAGKTTTLRALAGILTPSDGELHVAGIDVVASPIAAKRRLAYVPDDPPEFSDLTVAEHIAFYASVYGVDSVDEKTDRLLEQFQLEVKRNALARDLSRGMRQKLALCCALLHDPDALLLDEPMTGLDPPAIRQLKRSVHDRAAAGAAVIISSHLLAMVEDICTSLVILDRGRLRFAGSYSELREEFAHNASSQSLEEIFFVATGN